VARDRKEDEATDDIKNGRDPGKAMESEPI